jgi:enamine deaminase RidA (YjgF/YER057c/UK114 family)
MERYTFNAGQQWQDGDGFVQACEVRGGRRVLYCSGQLSVDPSGKPLYVGDMKGQIAAALDNLENLLKEADFKMADIVRLNIFTTDIDLCLQNYGTIIDRLKENSCLPACTLLGITRLAWPETLIEIEAIAETE